MSTQSSKSKPNRLNWTSVPDDLFALINEESVSTNIPKSELISKYVRLGITAQDADSSTDFEQIELEQGHGMVLSFYD